MKLCLCLALNSVTCGKYAKMQEIRKWADIFLRDCKHYFVPHCSVSLTGAKRRHPSGDRDPRNAVSGHQETQLPTWGRFLFLRAAPFQCILGVAPVNFLSCVLFLPASGLHYRLQGSLGAASAETRVCREHLLPLQGVFFFFLYLFLFLFVSFELPAPPWV